MSPAHQGTQTAQTRGQKNGTEISRMPATSTTRHASNDRQRQSPLPPAVTGRDHRTLSPCVAELGRDSINPGKVYKRGVYDVDSVRDLGDLGSEFKVMATNRASAKMRSKPYGRAGAGIRPLSDSLRTRLLMLSGGREKDGQLPLPSNNLPLYSSRRRVVTGRVNHHSDAYREILSG